jgi:hypothetical protein
MKVLLAWVGLVVGIVIGAATGVTALVYIFAVVCAFIGIAIGGNIDDEVNQRRIREEHERQKAREENEDGETWSGFVRAPLSLKNKYGGFFFYAEHLVGVVSEIFGYYPSSVKTFVNEKKLTVVFRYDGYDVIGLYTDENYSCYYAMRASEKQVRGSEMQITNDNPCFKIEFDEFYSLLCGEAQKKSYEDFIAPVFVMNAIKRSLDIGEEVKVRRYDLQ